MTITKRRICWPDPDATCLEGGCIHCNEYLFRSVSSIERWARRHVGLIKHRNGREVDATVAFRYGKSRNFNNAETK